MLTSSDYSSFAAKIGTLQVDPPLISNLDPINPIITLFQSSAGQDGFLASSDWTKFNNKLTSVAASGTVVLGNSAGVASATTITGDVTFSSSGATTLSSTGVASGTYSRVSVDAKGRVTSAYVQQDLAAANVSGTLTVPNGGTGLATVTSGGLLVGNGVGALTTLSGGTTGNVIYATGANTWASATPNVAGLVDLTTTQTISGDKSFANILVKNGNGVKYYNASSSNFVQLRSPAGLATDLTWNLPTSNGSNGNVLTTDGAGTLSWSSSFSSALASGTIFIGNGSNVATSTAVTGDVLLSNSGVTTLASTGVVSGTYSRVSVDAKGRVTAATSLLDLTTSVSGTLPVGNGGTGQSTLTSGSLVIGNAAGAVTTLAGGTIGNLLYASGASTWSSGTKDTIGIFANGGNTFGAATTIGSKDGNALNFMTNGAIRASLSTTGALSVSSDTTLGVPNAVSGGVPASASTLQVNGQAYSNVQTSTTNTTLAWDANSGNVMRWSPTTATTVNISNMKPGGAYMLVISGGGTGSVTINCYSGANPTGPLPTGFVPANGSRVAGALNKTVYTLMSDGANCLITWITGY